MMSGSSEDCFNVHIAVSFFLVAAVAAVVVVWWVSTSTKALHPGHWRDSGAGGRVVSTQKKTRKKPLTVPKTLRFNLINLSTYHFSPFFSTFFCQRNHKNPMMRPVLLEFGLIDALDWQTVAASMIQLRRRGSLTGGTQRLRCRLDVVTWQPPRSSTGRTSRRRKKEDPFWRDLYFFKLAVLSYIVSSHWRFIEPNPRRGSQHWHPCCQVKQTMDEILHITSFTTVSMVIVGLRGVGL